MRLWESRVDVLWCARASHMKTWIAELRAQQNQASPEGPKRTTAHLHGARKLGHT